VTTTRATRLAVVTVTTALLALALVLGMWQRVDAACEGDAFDPEDPVATCQGPEQFDLGEVSAEPPVTVARTG
jgi:hypothetical protein